MLKSEDFLQVGKFLIFSHLFYSRVAHIARLSPEWKHAVRVASHNAQPGNGKSFRRVTLGDNKSTIVRSVSTSPVGVVKLRNTRDTRLLRAVRFLELFVNFGGAQCQQVIEDTRSQHVLDEFWFKINGISNF